MAVDYDQRQPRTNDQAIKRFIKRATTMTTLLKTAAMLLLAASALSATPAAAQQSANGLDKIENIVIIFPENRSFDNLYGQFPGANGLKGLKANQYLQTDRDGGTFVFLPPVWGGLTAKGAKPHIPQSATNNIPNQPFALDDPKGFDLPLGTITNNPVHAFYQNQMQINGGKNDRFVAWTNVGALVMGYYTTEKVPLYPYAKEYTLGDNMFIAAFGGSFLNHIWLVCGCTPYYPDADKSPAKGLISAVNPDGVSLQLEPYSPITASDGPPVWANAGTLTPDFYAVNTMQPPYQPSNNKPAPGGNPAYANPRIPTTLPPQKQPTIGEALTAKGISWAWYAGAWKLALEGKNAFPIPNFVTHHQPFNYFAAYAPGTKAREQHLRDGGLAGSALIKVIREGKLPQVTFYKPEGNLNEHPGYSDVLAAEQHIVEIIKELQKGPQWSKMMVIVTYDDNGGFWDHVAPPKADRWGPGTRVPLIVVSPFAKKGFVDHTFYDLTSVMRLLTKRFDLPMLESLKTRDAAFAKNVHEPPRDLTNTLDLSQK